MILGRQLCAAPPDHFPLVLEGTVVLDSGSVFQYRSVWVDFDGYAFHLPDTDGFFVPDGTSLRWNDDLLTTVVCDSGLVGRTLVGDGFKFVILSIDYGWSWHPSQQVYLLLYGFGAAMSLHFGLIGMSFVVRAFKGGAYAVLR